MEKVVSPGKKKRPVLWITLVVLVLLVGVLGWQAKSLLPLPSPAPTPAPVRAKVPKQPPPMPIQTPEPASVPMTADPNIDTTAAMNDGTIVQTDEGTLTPMAETEPSIEQNAPEPAPQSEAIAPEPDQESIAENQPLPQSVPTQAAEEQQPAPPTEANPAPTAPSPSSLASTSAPQSDSATMPPEAITAAPFTIQVGAFLTKTYADDKIAVLSQKGYEPYIFEVTDAKKRSWYAVRFGHFETRDQAAQSLSEFKTKEKMDGIISRSDSL